MKPGGSLIVSREIEMVKRTDVEFEVDGGLKLRGWLFVPPGDGRRPAITMAHGYAGVKEHALEPFARAFVEAGFVVLLHDHRGFGASEGMPRHDIDPWRQIADLRRAISFLETLDLLYDAFGRVRLSEGWPKELAKIQKWLQREERGRLAV